MEARRCGAPGHPVPDVLIACDHPALAGHFPGDPVVPAAVVLARIVAAANEVCPGHAVCGVRKAKFVQRVEPGETLAVEFGEPAPAGLKFTARQRQHPVIQGRLALRAPA